VHETAPGRVARLLSRREYAQTLLRQTAAECFASRAHCVAASHFYPVLYPPVRA